MKIMYNFICPTFLFIVICINYMHATKQKSFFFNVFLWFGGASDVVFVSSYHKLKLDMLLWKSFPVEEFTVSINSCDKTHYDSTGVDFCYPLLLLIDFTGFCFCYQFSFSAFGH